MGEELEVYITETLNAFSKERGIPLENEQQASIVRSIADALDSGSRLKHPSASRPYTRLDGTKHLTLRTYRPREGDRLTLLKDYLHRRFGEFIYH